MSDQTQTAPQPLLPEVSPQPIAERVWVFPDERINLVPNIGVVVGEDAALVVDTGMGRRNGERLLARVRELTEEKPLLLTLTHFHPEHGWGAQAFHGGATIVYNRIQREELEEKFSPFVELFSSFGPEIAELLADVELVRPHVVYADAAELDLGGVTVQLSHEGPAHTRGDQLVLLPAERVLFAGDLVENRFFPILPDEDAQGSKWIELLERMQALEPATVVPGHGEVGDAGLIEDAREYLEHVRARVDETAAVGASLDEAKTELEPEIRRRYANWDNEIWIGFAIENFYRERNA